MNNIINAQNINNNNPIGAKKISVQADTKQQRGAIPAPDYLPKYSLNKKINEADQFRKSIIYSNYRTKQKKKNRKKFLTALATTIAGVFVFAKLKKM